MKNFRCVFPYISKTAVPENINELLIERAFDGLSDCEREGKGWARIGDERMLTVDGKYLFRYLASKRRPDQLAVQRLLNERTDEVVEDGREVTPELMEEMRFQAENDVMKYSPISSTAIYILMWPARRLLLVSGGTASKCEDALSFLRKTLGNLHAMPWGNSHFTSTAVTKNMTEGNSIYKLPSMLAISPYGKTLFTGEDTSLKITLDGVSNDTDDARNILSGMTARSVEMSLYKRPDNGQIENLANFNLVMPPNGNVHFKSFDYDDDMERDDVSQALIAEMHLVTNYTHQILSGLEEFIGEDLEENSLTPQE